MARLSTFWETERPEGEPRDWTFAGAPTRDLTHCYHDYPARMIPQVAGRLLDEYGRGAERSFDPYCGSGTSLVEGTVRGLDAAGTDLNPLARLISKAKTAAADADDVRRRISEMDEFVASPPRPEPPRHIAGVSRLDFWFKPRVVEELSVLKSFIAALPDGATRLFFQVAFSETVRESSNTRNEEFKLYRYDEERLKQFSPDVFRLMRAKLGRNFAGLQQFTARLRLLGHAPRARVYDFDTKSGVPAELVPRESIDIVVTSPPYGDSHTTVAYGQYSRLSAAWLGLEAPEKVDGRLMGGSALRTIPVFPCDELNEVVAAIRLKDEKRAREVATFYEDLRSSIAHVSSLLKPRGHACYVVGNRKVKGCVLPTDLAIRRFFETHGFTHVGTFHRRIPNKRMPLRNSPTNVTGSVDNTMADEHIVVMRRGR